MQKSIAIHHGKAVNAYSLLVFAIEGIVASTLSSDRLAYQKIRRDATQKIAELINGYSENEISDLIRTITEEAARDISASLDIGIPSNTIQYAHQKNVESYYQLNSYMNNAMKNILQSADSLIKQGSLERMSGISINAIDTQVEKLIKDKAGRKLAVASYIETTIRKHLVDAYINAYSAISSAMGHDTIIVTYADQTHRNNGLKLSIRGYAELPSLESKRKEIFHPNTYAEVGIFK